MVAALKRFVVHLLGGRFVIRIDQQAMKYLNSMRNTNGHLTCWALAIMPFIFDDHHPSKFNGNAVGLTRQIWNDWLKIQEEDCNVRAQP